MDVADHVSYPLSTASFSAKASCPTGSTFMAILVTPRTWKRLAVEASRRAASEAECRLSLPVWGIPRRTQVHPFIGYVAASVEVCEGSEGRIIEEPDQGQRLVPQLHAITEFEAQLTCEGDA